MLGARTIVIEDGLKDALDLQEEDQDILALRPDFKLDETEVCRISFFRDVISKSTIGAIAEDSFIGYAIFKRDGIKDRIYESVFATSKRENNFVRGAPSWTCAVAGREFTITGHLYAQQNGVTNCCAHVAVRTAATCFLGEDLSYRQMNKWVSEYRKAEGIDETPPGEGLTNLEICHILEKSGAKTFVADFEQAKLSPIPYQLRLYSSVESGFPTIMFFGLEQQADEDKRGYHAIPIFGHTFNEDMWVPSADMMYFPLHKVTKCLTSSAWVSMFIGHDDNYGSNGCIPQHYMEPHRICRNEEGHAILDDNGKTFTCRQQGGSVLYAIATVPSNIKADPIEAEAIAADYLLTILEEVPETFPGWHERWQNRLALHKSDTGTLLVRRPEKMILRTSLVTGSEYCDHIRSVRGWDSNKRITDSIKEILSSVADDPFWMTEVSIPELFSANRRKVGEVLIRADREPSLQRDAGSFLFARLPGCFAFLEPSDSAASSPADYAPSFLYVPVDIDDHVELLGCEEATSL